MFSSFKENSLVIMSSLGAIIILSMAIVCGTLPNNYCQIQTVVISKGLFQIIAPVL